MKKDLLIFPFLSLPSHSTTALPDISSSSRSYLSSQKITWTFHSHFTSAPASLILPGVDDNIFSSMQKRKTRSGIWRRWKVGEKNVKEFHNSSTAESGEVNCEFNKKKRRGNLKREDLAQIVSRRKSRWIANFNLKTKKRQLMLTTTCWCSDAILISLLC